MATLENFFSELEAAGINIPVYKGDWNDWWADGVGSTPGPVKLFREAQRKLNVYFKLGGELTAEIEEARDNLMLYAEHTWGSSSSVGKPWETPVHILDLRKTGYAVDAYTQITRMLDGNLAKRGEVSISHNRKQRWHIINPHGYPVTLPVLLYVGSWESIDGVRFGNDTPFEIVDEATGKKIDAQKDNGIEILLSLQGGEEKTVVMKLLRQQNKVTVQNHAHIGTDGVKDILLPGQTRCDYEKIETDDFVLSFDRKKGLTGIIDKKSNKSLIDPAADTPAFSGVYEITPVNGDLNIAGADVIGVRTRMGRNRKSPATRRFYSECFGIKITEAGPVFIGCELDFSMEGTCFYQVFLKIYRHSPLIDARVRIHKTSRREPENLYVSLPFTAGEGETRYIEKTGCMVRPGIDQLPGTNQLFYSIQNGVIFAGDKRTIILSIKDAPLITFGSLEAHPIDLSKDENWELNRSPLYSWVMNNFWETNFKADLGGFYEFSYILGIQDPVDIRTARNLCTARNEGIPAFSIG
jgi:hypothetical protein